MKLILTKIYQNYVFQNIYLWMKTIQTQMRRKERRKRQKLVERNAFTKEDEVFDVEASIINKDSHHTILGMHRYTQAEAVSLLLQS